MLALLLMILFLILWNINTRPLSS